MKITVKNKQNKNDQLSFVKTGCFSWTLQNGQTDSFLSVYFLFEFINFKNV